VNATDRAIVNALQAGFPLSERPYRDAAEPLGLTEAELLQRLQVLLDTGVLSRFGPLWNIERLGGAYTLAALHAPEAEFERVAEQVNAHPQIAHNYAREHELNMWFVVAARTRQEIDAVLAAIERETGCTVLDFPKEREFFIGARFDV
jgi:DNA-binding Lrp family transcriptional regulator